MVAGVSFEDALASYLNSTLVPAAIARWESMLSVIPVTGNLFASR
jgi:hypothetical protein